MPCALLMGFVLLFVAACSDDEKGSGQIKVADESELEQTLSGDQQTSTVSFVAASDWTSTVSEITPPPTEPVKERSLVLVGEA